jgi:hypothetical protein
VALGRVFSEYSDILLSIPFNQYLHTRAFIHVTDAYKVTLRLKCDGTHAETRFRLSTKRTSPFKSAGASVQSTTGSRGVRISGSSAGCIMFRGSAKGTGYPVHSPVSPSLPLPCVTVCHHISTGLYHLKACLTVIHTYVHRGPKRSLCSKSFLDTTTLKMNGESAQAQLSSAIFIPTTGSLATRCKFVWTNKMAKIS